MSSSTPSPSLAAAAGETTMVVVKKEFGADDDDGSHDRSENQVIVSMYSAAQIQVLRYNTGSAIRPKNSCQS